MTAQNLASFFTRASAGWYYNSAGVLTQAAANAPRFDYDPVTLAVRGLLIEEARTNLIRNNSMAGAGPGVSPTFWSIPWTSSNGVSWTFVGTGTESGIPYIDVRLSGTASAQVYLPISIETPGALTPGQTYTLSGYLRLVAGSLTGGTYGVGEGLRLVETRSSGGALYNGINLGTITGASLASQRYSVTKVIDALTTSTGVSFQVPISSGQPIDATFRIGAPQLELGAAVSSPILTNSAQATRSSDICSLYTGAWFNNVEGTLYAEIMTGPGIGTNNQILASFDDLTINNRLALYKVPAGNVKAFSRVASVLQSDLTGASTGNMQVVKSAFAFKTNDFALCVGGAAAVTASAGTLPAVASLVLGDGSGSGAKLNGWLRDLRYYPRRLSNAELQALTT